MDANDALDLLSLAQSYPPMKSFIFQSQSRWTMDFRNVSACRCLMNAMLKTLNLPNNLVIPLNTLIPAVNNRADYIKWVFEFIHDSNVVGLDIGTGASCIYPILGCLLWKCKSNLTFMATDIDPLAVDFASSNVRRNHLEHRIQVILNKDKSRIFPDELFQRNTSLPIYGFSICNPPFYSSLDEMRTLAAKKSLEPHGYWTCSATLNEAVVEGGELAFIQRMYAESLALKYHVKWFTTLIGMKKTFQQVKEYLHKEKEAKQVQYTHFTRGYTTRYAIGWSFYED